MTAVTVSPKFQVVIPRAVRAALDLKAGQKVEVFAFQGRIEIVPVRPMRRLRGIAKGMPTAVGREGDGEGDRI